MPFNHRPHLARVIGVARPEQVAEERVHGDEIHVVMIFRHVAVGVNGGFAAREVELFVGGRNGFRNRAGVLLSGKAREVRRRAFVPAQRVARILSAPAEQTRPPCDRAVHERLLLPVPNRVGGDVQRGSGGVDERVGCLDDHALRNRAAIFLGPGKNPGQVGCRVNGNGFVVGRGFTRMIFADFAINRQFFPAFARQLLPGQINRLARRHRNLSDDHGQGRGSGGGSQQRGRRFPLGRVGHGQCGAGRHHAGDGGFFVAERERVCPDGKGIVAALLRLQPEKLRNRLVLTADITIARAAQSIRAAVSPDQIGRSGAAPFRAHNETFGGRQRQHGQVQFAVAEERIPDFIKQRAGTVARDDLLRVVQPFHAGGGFDSKTQIAAAPRQVERELRPVATVNAEAGVQAIKRTVEKFRAVRDDEIRPDRPITQRPRGLVRKIAPRMIEQLRSKGGRAIGGGPDLRQGRCAQCQSGDEKRSGHDGGFCVHTMMK